MWKVAIKNMTVEMTIMTYVGAEVNDKLAAILISWTLTIVWVSRRELPGEKYSTMVVEKIQKKKPVRISRLLWAEKRAPHHRRRPADSIRLLTSHLSKNEIDYTST